MASYLHALVEHNSVNRLSIHGRVGRDFRGECRWVVFVLQLDPYLQLAPFSVLSLGNYRELRGNELFPSLPSLRYTG